jgi:hypothetical protein
MNLKTLRPLCNRCKELTLKLPVSDDRNRLLNMIETLLINHTWPDLKIGKWLGFIEGQLIASKVTTVDNERDFTRPIFHKYYKEMKITIPKTTDVMKD